MNYLRALVIFISLCGMAHAPLVMAHAEIWLGNAMQWEKTVYADTGESTYGYGPMFNTSVSFSFDYPELNIDMEQPLASSLTLSLSQPSRAIFYDQSLDYEATWANVQGYVTYESDWSIREWNFSADMFMRDSLYGTFTSVGSGFGPSESVMKLHIDNYQPRWFVEPVDIIEYSATYGLEIMLNDLGDTVAVPESSPLILLMFGLTMLMARRMTRVSAR